MPDTFQSYKQAKPRRVCRSQELRENAILKLALKSLQDVKAAQQLSSHIQLPVRRSFPF